MTTNHYRVQSTLAAPALVYYRRMKRWPFYVAVLCLCGVLAAGGVLRQTAAEAGGACASTAYWPRVLVLSADLIVGPALGSPAWRHATYVRCRLIVLQGWHPAYADVTYLLNRLTRRPEARWSNLPGPPTRPLWP